MCVCTCVSTCSFAVEITHNRLWIMGDNVKWVIPFKSNMRNEKSVVPDVTFSRVWKNRLFERMGFCKSQSLSLCLSFFFFFLQSSSDVDWQLKLIHEPSIFPDDPGFKVWSGRVISLETSTAFGLHTGCNGLCPQWPGLWVCPHLCRLSIPFQINAISLEELSKPWNYPQSSSPYSWQALITYPWGEKPESPSSFKKVKRKPVAVK